jgi:hypothetical protein
VRNFVSQARVLKGEWKARWSSGLLQRKGCGRARHLLLRHSMPCHNENENEHREWENRSIRSEAMEVLESFITVPVSNSRNANRLVFIMLYVDQDVVSFYCQKPSKRSRLNHALLPDVSLMEVYFCSVVSSFFPPPNMPPTYPPALFAPLQSDPPAPETEDPIAPA